MGLRYLFLCNGKRTSEESMEKHNALENRGVRCFDSVQFVSSGAEEVRKQGPRLSLALGGKPQCPRSPTLMAESFITTET